MPDTFLKVWMKIKRAALLDGPEKGFMGWKIILPPSW